MATLFLSPQPPKSVGGLRTRGCVGEGKRGEIRRIIKTFSNEQKPCCISLDVRLEIVKLLALLANPSLRRYVCTVHIQHVHTHTSADERKTPGDERGDRERQERIQGHQPLLPSVVVVWDGAKKRRKGGGRETRF